MTDSKEQIEKEEFKRAVEKYCEVGDARSDFWLDVNTELGPNAEAVLSRLWEKHFNGRIERRLFVPKWENITREAKERMLNSISRGTTNSVNQ